MENNKDNLGNFFRKKLTEQNSSDDSWARPDENVRSKILEEISTPVKSTANTSNLFWKVAFAIALLLAGGYIWHLHQKNNEIKNVLQAQNEKLEKIETDFLILKNENHSTISDLVSKNENLIVEKNQTLIQQEKLIETIQTEKSKTSHLYAEKNILKKELESLSKIAFKETDDTEKDETIIQTKINKISFSEIIKNIYPIALNQYLLQKSAIAKNDEVQEIIESPAPEIIKKIEPVETKQQRFEVGYEYAHMSYDIPVQRKFERQRSFTKNIESNKTKVSSHGAYFAYSPKKNWWIRTGIRMANMDIRREFEMGLIYDKEKEIPDPRGGTSNQLALTTSTPYTETESSFDIRFEEGKELDDGDFLKLTINDFQRFNYTQVPIGVEYFYGTGKLQWLFQGGLQWNRLEFGEYSFAVSSEAKDGNAIIERKEVISKKIPAKHFLSAYIGLGLDYHLFNNFHARASFNLNHNFNKNNNNKADFSASSKTGTAFRMGLNYRF